MKKHKSLIEQIYKAGVTFLRPLSLKKTYECILEELKKLMRASDGTIYLFIEGRLRRVHSDSASLSNIIPRKRGSAYKAYKEGKVIVLNKEYLQKYHPEHLPLYKNVVLIPLQNRSKPFGVIALRFKRKHIATTKKIPALKLYSSLATLAIHKAQLYQTISRALEDRDLFISIAAHELKTPLTAISVYNQLISGSVKKKHMPDDKWSENIHEQVGRMNRLISEFLQVKSIKKGELKYTFKTCSLEDIIQHAIKDAHSRYPRHTITYESKLKNEGDYINGDSDKLTQVFINVLNNAAKFSSDTEEIHMTLEKKDHSFMLTIVDRGVGISGQELPRIFSKYYKGKHKRQGMGIGLYLSKNIIEAHKGEVQVRSVVNKGTTFRIKLPIAFKK